MAMTLIEQLQGKTLVHRFSPRRICTIDRFIYLLSDRGLSSSCTDWFSRVVTCWLFRLRSNWTAAFVWSRFWRRHPLCQQRLNEFPHPGLFSPAVVLTHPNGWECIILALSPPRSLGVSYFLLWCRGNLTSAMRRPDLRLWITAGPHQYSRSRPLLKLLYSPSFSPPCPLSLVCLSFSVHLFNPCVVYLPVVFICARWCSVILKLRERWKNSLMAASWIFITAVLFCCTVWKHDPLNIPREEMH